MKWADFKARLEKTLSNPILKLMISVIVLAAAVIFGILFMLSGLGVVGGLIILLGLSALAYIWLDEIKDVIHGLKKEPKPSTPNDVKKGPARIIRQRQVRGRI